MDLAAEHSKIRIFVRRQDNGSISVEIRDTGEAEPGGWWRFWRCKNKVPYRARLTLRNARRDKRNFLGRR